MATGVLALVVGSATRLAQFYGKQLKTYQAEILFGKFQIPMMWRAKSLSPA